MAVSPRNKLFEVFILGSLCEGEKHGTAATETLPSGAEGR
jgi:hypothetical protein